MNSWLGHCVKARAFRCMSPYHVERHTRNGLAPILFADNQPEARAHFDCAPAQLSPRGPWMRTKRHAVDGTPIMAWHDLLLISAQRWSCRSASAVRSRCLPALQPCKSRPSRCLACRFFVSRSRPLKRKRMRVGSGGYAFAK